MRLLICGDRNWTDTALIGEWIDRLAPTLVIEGECGTSVIRKGKRIRRGADRIARDEAERRGIKVEPYPALWEIHGAAAGPIRNQQMLDEGDPDEVIAFHDNLANSRGTRDMVRRASAAGLYVRVVSHTGVAEYPPRGFA